MARGPHPVLTCPNNSRDYVASTAGKSNIMQTVDVKVKCMRDKKYIRRRSMHLLCITQRCIVYKKTRTATDNAIHRY